MPPKPPTPKEIQSEQNRVLENDKTRAVAVVDPDAAFSAFTADLSQHALPGTVVKFDPKQKGFVRADTGEALPADDEYVVHWRQTLNSWTKWNGEGEPPTRHMGMPADGFVLPPRELLGDMDPDLWSEGLNGKPEDPWHNEVMVPLEHMGTAELFVFVTSSITGRRAVGKLLEHCRRVARAFPGEAPVIQLKVGGFNHRDDWIGWVSTPVLAHVSRVARADAVAPPAAALAAPRAEFDDFGAVLNYEVLRRRNSGEEGARRRSFSSSLTIRQGQRPLFGNTISRTMASTLALIR